MALLHEDLKGYPWTGRLDRAVDCAGDEDVESRRQEWAGHGRVFLLMTSASGLREH
jgi:hypothetical protein